MEKVNSFEDIHFHIVDYAVFIGMLILSAVSGAYFGFCRRHKIDKNANNTRSHSITRRESLVSEATAKNNNVNKKVTDFGSTTMNEYLLGSRKLKSFPVAMSLVASYISGVTILGTPSEIYNYGTQYWLIIIPIWLMGVTVSLVYLPVFCNLKLGSSYEYLELRFNSTVRTLASVMFVIDEILFLPIIIYVPALAFNQVTGANIYLIGGVICVVCIFYTLFGGIKAVVHTDAWQVVIMFLSVVVVVTLGTLALGGPGEIFRRASKGGRVKFFNTNPSLYERHTIWGVLIGGFLYWTSFNSVNQTMVQRYMSLPNLKRARLSVAIFAFGISLFVLVCCYAGLLVYAAYFDCDPKLSGLIKTDDQLLPIYVMQTVGHLRGVPGLFIAGVFGAAMSSLSVVLNSTSAVLLEDILKGCFNVKLSERSAGLFVKSCILVLGAIAMGFLFIVEKLGGIFSVASSLSAIAAGTTFGMFTLGMLVPWSNSKGALFGAIAGAIMSGWVSFGSQAVLAAGLITPNTLPVLNECPLNPSNITLSLDVYYPDESNVFPLYRLSFHWINPIGVFTVLIVGSAVSFLTGARKLKHIDPSLISPVIHRFLPKECFTKYGNISMKRNIDFIEEMDQLTVINTNDNNYPINKRGSEYADRHTNLS